MRIKDNEFETKVKQALREKSRLPASLEATLFSQAEALLATRRERIASRGKEALKAVHARTRRLTILRELPSRILELFTFYPDAPVAAITLATLLIAFLSIHNGSKQPLNLNLTYSDLPGLSKTNDSPAHYDEQRLAERQAYEREVENAHQQTSGGT